MPGHRCCAGAKYQNEGGPSPERIVQLLRQEVKPQEFVSDNIRRFIDALAFNWLIAGTDAHAKNYSVLIGARQVRLAPLYDVTSALPYNNIYLPKERMAMRVGGEYLIERISGRHWRRLAEQCGLDPADTVTRIDELAARLPGCLTAAAEEPAVQALASDQPARLLDRVAVWTRRCRTLLAQE